jgi:hypothetical protein
MMRADDVLVACRMNEDDTFVVRFFRVLRSTSNTCEVRELKKEIVRQIGRLQEVVPRVSVFRDSAPFRCRIRNEQVEIDEHCFARLWDGESKWQAAIIHVPE